MYNITLICTSHTEKGNCNSEELYKILEKINPEVIFDELPTEFAELFYSDNFQIAYSNNILNNVPMPDLWLEVKSIIRYKKNHYLKIVPVDISLDVNKHKEESLFLFKTLWQSEDFRNLDNQKEALVAEDGFNFLNSTNFLNLLNKQELLKRKIIKSQKDQSRLLEIYNTHREQNDVREDGMLEYIYNYSKEYPYNNAVFLIGARHKESIMQKIKTYEKQSELKLNWKMYTA